MSNLHRLSRAVSLSALIALGAAAQGPTYHTTATNQQLVTVGNQTCASTIYDPDVYNVAAAGQTPSITLLGHGSNFQWDACDQARLDSIFRAPLGSNGVWANPGSSDCPMIYGKVIRCDYIAEHNPDKTGPIGSPAVTRGPDGRFYMAYVAGNADLERGRVHWAYSIDGVQWTVHGGDVPKEVTSPVKVVAEPVIGLGQTMAACDNHGIAHVQLVYESGYFYFFLQYYHGLDIDGLPGIECSTLAYRIAYDPAQLTRLGATRQMYNAASNSWVAHNGILTFDYQQAGTLPVHGNYETRGYEYGASDVEWDAARGKWIHIFGTDANDKIYWQETTSLANGSWSPKKEVDLALLRNRFPTQYIHAPALWYGDLPSDASGPAFYMFTPVQTAACAPERFGGLSIAMSQLTFQ